MSSLRLHRPASVRLSGFIWPIIGLVLFGTLYVAALPHGRASDAMHGGAGPDGVTAFFNSPEAAVTRINAMLSAHEWTKLARYYDFSKSIVTADEARSGAYFVGGLAIAPEGPQARPFPDGWVYLYTEASGIDGVVRVVVGPPDEAASSSNTQGFLMMRYAEGYRVVPARRCGADADGPFGAVSLKAFEAGLAATIIDFDHPQVTVTRNGTRNVGLDVGIARWIVLQNAFPDAFATPAVDRAKKARTSVEEIDPH